MIIKTYWYQGRDYQIVHEFKIKEFKWAVCQKINGYSDELVVIPKQNLSKIDNSYDAVRTREIKTKITELEKEKEKVVDKLVDDAIKALAFRIRLNSIMSKDNKETVMGITIATEIEKLIKDKAKEL